jgi:hypothetical protein
MNFDYRRSNKPRTCCLMITINGKKLFKVKNNINLLGVLLAMLETLARIKQVSKNRSFIEVDGILNKVLNYILEQTIWDLKKVAYI